MVIKGRVFGKEKIIPLNFMIMGDVRCDIDLGSV